MGEGLVNSPSPGEETNRGENSPLSSYTEVFYKLLPTYMAMGMTPDEYWYGDADLPKAYREAFKLKRKLLNEELWLQGFYVYNAIGAFVEILPAFPAKNASVKPYMDSPIAFDADDEKRVEDKKEEANELAAKAVLEAWAGKVNSHFKGGED